VKFKITATIPVGQYANIIPEIEVDGAFTYEQARDEAMGRLTEIWSQYGTVPLKGAVASQSVINLTSMSGTTVQFDPVNHVYYKDGKTLLSGSAFAERYTPKFNKDAILPKFAAKHGVEASEIAEMWTMKGDVAKNFGTALHTALEFYGKHKKTIDATQGTFEIHPAIHEAVKSFFVSRENEQALYEPFIHFGEWCGSIDRLLITGDKKGIIEDYKTNQDLHKGSGKMLAPFDKMKSEPLSTYQLQLSFYATIMQKNGWTIEGLRIHHYTDKWETIELKVLNIEGVLNGQ
jgi:hypothetical protein